MAETVRLRELVMEARRLRRVERADFLRLVQKEDPSLAARLAELLEAEAGGGDPGGNGAPPAGPEGDETTELLRRLADRADPGGRYQPQGELARGGQGIVLCVHDEDLHRELAMKVILAKGDARTSYGAELQRRSLSRFLEEAQVTGQLDHPGIVPVHELGLDAEGRAYFTMKLVKGRELCVIFDHARQGAEGWNLTRAVGVVLKVCEAMAYAHAKGVIHRDLKPSNVMVGRYGEVYVMDWGIARVLGTRDGKDIRIRSEEETEPSPRRGPQAGATLVTMDGDVLGTPAYMSPEQAKGEIDRMGPPSDVYSVGAMLYHLLTGAPPFVSSESNPSHFAIWSRLKAGPPVPLRKYATDVPAELEAICDRAMARRPEERYHDMQALAEDLRAYLEQRVVRAYEAGPFAELRKWMARNRKLAATAVAAVVFLAAGLVVATVLKQRADRERANVLRLSAFRDLEELRAEADRLWPAWPEKGDAYRDWLVRARSFVAGLEPDAATGDVGHRRQLERLRASALPVKSDTAKESGDPRLGELRERRAQLDMERRALGVLRGHLEVEAPALPANASENALELVKAAQPLVDPYRTRFGRELEGLALARRASQTAQDDAEYARSMEVLAWALFANGLRAEALSASEEGLLAAPDHAELLQTRAVLVEAIDTDPVENVARRVVELEDQVQRLQAEILDDRRWRFAGKEDTWWHEQLVEIVEGIEAFADPETGLIDGVSIEHGWGVARRLAWADTVRLRTLESPEARERWSEALGSIADPEECPAYAGLRIDPQLGLLPLGRDAASGLWEFTHPLTGAEPQRDEDGAFVLDEDTGLVFVLLPEADFLMGSQKRDPQGRNYDRQAMGREAPVHRVQLAPFFLSKYEMTQAQWIRFAGYNPSRSDPSSRHVYSLVHPVEQMSWKVARRTLERMGLTLPTEAQWEYAARAGTDTPWWCGTELDSLVGVANLADTAAARAGNNWTDIVDWLDDGHAWHAPITFGAPNPFGLYGVHGNVWELTLDLEDAAFYRRSPRQDPVSLHAEDDEVVVRGGSFFQSPGSARSAFRGGAPADIGRADVGLRPARALRSGRGP